MKQINFFVHRDLYSHPCYNYHLVGIHIFLWNLLTAISVQFLVSFFFITARIRRMTGGYIFTLCVSSRGEGVPTFRVVGGGTYSGLGGGYLPSQVWVGGGGRGTYLPGGRGCTYSQVWMGGYLLRSGWGGGTYSGLDGGGYLPWQGGGGTYLG